MNPLWQRIYAVVERIPEGRVATYGQVAALAGLPRQARLVGYSLHGLPDGSTLPWQRVVNAQGRVSQRAEPGYSEGLQRHLLEEEGVVFDLSGRIDLKRYRWEPDAAKAAGLRPTTPRPATAKPRPSPRRGRARAGPGSRAPRPAPKRRR
jgi:methylated-DNA-protein-cysteine methyltransferase-like protein